MNPVMPLARMWPDCHEIVLTGETKALSSSWSLGHPIEAMSAWIVIRRLIQRSILCYRKVSIRYAHLGIPAQAGSWNCWSRWKKGLWAAPGFLIRSWVQFTDEVSWLSLAS